MTKRALPKSTAALDRHSACVIVFVFVLVFAIAAAFDRSCLRCVVAVVVAAGFAAGSAIYNTYRHKRSVVRVFQKQISVGIKRTSREQAEPERDWNPLELQNRTEQ